MPVRLVSILALSILTIAVPTSIPQEQKSFSGRSKTCGPIVGKTAQDLQNVKVFCEAISEDFAREIVGSYAMESLLWVKINRGLANAMLADRLSTERVVKKWMRRWKNLSKSKAVTVWVEWLDVQIAKGDTTLFSGDKITIKQ